MESKQPSGKMIATISVSTITMMILISVAVDSKIFTEEYANIKKAENTVIERLKDPRSAEFLKVRFLKYQNTLPVVCGEVNSKNSLGGYPGFVRFLSIGTFNDAYLEGDGDGLFFLNFWKKFCEK